jgi:hypothetical protein
MKVRVNIGLKTGAMQPVFQLLEPTLNNEEPFCGVKFEPWMDINFFLTSSGHQGQTKNLWEWLKCH